MKKKLWIVITTLGVVFSSCGKHNCEEGKSCDHDKNSETEIFSDKPEEESHEEHYHYKALKFNEGEKWDANIETTIGVANMVIIAAEKMTDATTENYKELGDKYQKELNVIFSECNMTGAAHDQLHNFLLPLIDKVDTLKKCKSAKNGVEIASDIKIHLDLYLEYFK